MNIEMKVTRKYGDKCTIGTLNAVKSNKDFSLLELPWKGNGKNVSCIPEGVYPYEVRYSVTWRRKVIWILGVPNRTAIQMHVGNSTRDSRGCGLVGEYMDLSNHDKTKNYVVSKSIVSLDALLELIPEKGMVEFKS